MLSKATVDNVLIHLDWCSAVVRGQYVDRYTALWHVSIILELDGVGVNVNMRCIPFGICERRKFQSWSFEVDESLKRRGRLCLLRSGVTKSSYRRAEMCDRLTSLDFCTHCRTMSGVSSSCAGLSRPACARRLVHSGACATAPRLGPNSVSGAPLIVFSDTAF